MLDLQHQYNNCTTTPHMRVGPTRKMLDLQHQYNNCTTILHMRVGPTYWDPPSCEGLLYNCCIGVVQESNPVPHTRVHPHVRGCVVVVMV
jgi:hypothetical protein